MTLYRLFFKRYIRLEKPRTLGLWGILGAIFFIGGLVIGASLVSLEHRTWIYDFVHKLRDSSHWPLVKTYKAIKIIQGILFSFAPVGLSQISSPLPSSIHHFLSYASVVFLFVGVCLFIFFFLRRTFTLFFVLSIFGIFIGTSALGVVLIEFTGHEEYYKTPFEHDWIVVPKTGPYLDKAEQVEQLVRSTQGVQEAFLYVRQSVITKGSLEQIPLCSVSTSPQHALFWPGSYQDPNWRKFLTASSQSKLRLKRVLYTAHYNGSADDDLFIKLLLPGGDISPFGAMPKLRTFRILIPMGPMGREAKNYYEGDCVYTTMEALQDLLHGPQEPWVYSGVHWRPVSSNNPQKIQQDIQRKLDKLGANYAVKPYEDLRKLVRVAIAIEKKVALVVILIFGLIAILAIISSGFMLVARKKKSIAILKTMGASHLQVFTVFAQLGFFIGLIGGFLGVLFGTLIVLFINKLLVFSTILAPPVFLKSDLVICFMMGFFLGLLGILFPSVVASVSPVLKGLKE